MMLSKFTRHALAALATLVHLVVSAAGTAGGAPMTQSDINLIPDSSAREIAQWQYDQAKMWPTQSDGIERSTDINGSGQLRKYFTPQKLTAADCLTGRHWELTGGYAGCVCDGDTTHTRVSNDDPAACTPPPPPPIKGGGSVSSGFTFGGLGSPTGAATPSADTITGSWTMSANYGSSIDLSYSGNLGSMVGVFSGTCNFQLYDYGGGDYGLSGPCGSGTAYSWGGVYVNFSGPTYSGTFNGSWGGWGASGTLNATINSGIQLYSISQSGSTIGFILMDSSGTFTGYDQGSTIRGYINSQGIGAITLGTGNYYAAMTGNGVFGTIRFPGQSYAIGGTPSNFFMVDSGGNIFGTGYLSNIAANDPGWASYLTQNGLPVPAGFNSLLSLSTGNGLYYACIAGSSATCYGPSGKQYIISSP